MASPDALLPELRLDLLLVRLRFARSRASAQAWINQGHIRCNGRRMTQTASRINCGDVLTLPIGQTVRIIKIIALPERRGPPGEAQSCYENLDAG